MSSMSSVRGWAAALFSSSHKNLNVEKTIAESNEHIFKTCDASIQTLLTASTSANVSKEWLLQDVSEDLKDEEVLYLADSKHDLSAVKRMRRKVIPDKPNQRLNVWSILKDLIGQNLTTIALPVNFNEPLTFLQRLTEGFQYSFLLDKAADAENIYDQIAYLSVFSISSYATSAERTGKPFNPLLGETYECDRSDDLGWKSIAEQVSHHPAISALHCESEKWVYWMEVSANILFRGKYIRMVPNEVSYVKFKNNQKTYKIGRVQTIVNNLIFGNIWLDHSGECDIIGLNDDLKCTLKFVPYSSFSRGPQRKVNGIIKNESNQIKRLIRGNWDSKISVAFNVDNDHDDDIDEKNPIFETVWERQPPNPGSEKYYNFSEFTCSLNENEYGVAPTDSRRRPDLKMMEEANWDKSNELKLQLEEKQRQVAYRRETENAALLVQGITQQYMPTWFVKTKDTRSSNNENSIYVYKGGYWEAKERCEWSRCPDIF